MKVTELTKAILAERRRQREAGEPQVKPKPKRIEELRRAFETAQ
jgi:hypothetical protein